MEMLNRCVYIYIHGYDTVVASKMTCMDVSEQGVYNPPTYGRLTGDDDGKLW